MHREKIEDGWTKGYVAAGVASIEYEVSLLLVACDPLNDRREERAGPIAGPARIFSAY
jgi:hypothetical protein